MAAVGYMQTNVGQLPIPATRWERSLHPISFATDGDGKKNPLHLRAISHFSALYFGHWFCEPRSNQNACQGKDRGDSKNVACPPVAVRAKPAAAFPSMPAMPNATLT